MPIIFNKKPYYQIIMAENNPIQSEESNWEYHNPAGDKFPIMATDPRPPYPGNVIKPGSNEKPSVSED